MVWVIVNWAQQALVQLKQAVRGGAVMCKYVVWFWLESCCIKPQTSSVYKRYVQSPAGVRRGGGVYDHDK